MQGINKNGFDVVIAQAGAGMHAGKDASVRWPGLATHHLQRKRRAHDAHRRFLCGRDHADHSVWSQYGIH